MDAGKRNFVIGVDAFFAVVLSVLSAKSGGVWGVLGYLCMVLVVTSAILYWYGYGE